MSIPPDSPWRGCASFLSQPVDRNDVLAAQNLVESVYYFNCRREDAPLADIVYRSSDADRDVIRHVFRWDLTPYQQVFQNGFTARRQEGTPDETYYDLDHYVHHGGRPLDSTRPTTHAFVSTTLNSGWRPPGEGIEVYRYEIFAPGGIWIAETLGDQYGYPAQDEVCFVAGIAPQYIRSAQLFRATRQAGSQYVTWSRVDNRIIVNGHFSPQTHPYALLNIQRPVFDYIAENGTRSVLTITIYRPQLPPSESAGRKVRRQVSDDAFSDDAIKWYTGAVADTRSYINSAFRSSRTNEAYLFMKNEYVLLDYAPGTTSDRILTGPRLICDGYPSLSGTSFAEHGIDCAFDSDGNQAFIFSGNLCAHIDYAPGTSDDKILQGPLTITAMFPILKDTVFGNGLDAAFRSSKSKEAYLFKGDQYARINYDSKELITIRNISGGFYSLRGTIFATGLDAAFASHRKDEVYIFKDDQYVRINFAPGRVDDYIIDSVKPIIPDWPSLGNVLPRMNRGLDSSDYHNEAQPDRDHDEL